MGKFKKDIFFGMLRFYSLLPLRLNYIPESELASQLNPQPPVRDEEQARHAHLDWCFYVRSFSIPNRNFLYLLLQN